MRQTPALTPTISDAPKPAHGMSMMGMPPGLAAGSTPARYEVPQPGRQPGEVLLQPAQLRPRRGR